MQGTGRWCPLRLRDTYSRPWSVALKQFLRCGVNLGGLTAGLTHRMLGVVVLLARHDRTTASPLYTAAPSSSNLNGVYGKNLHPVPIAAIVCHKPPLLMVSGAVFRSWQADRSYTMTSCDQGLQTIVPWASGGGQGCHRPLPVRG